MLFLPQSVQAARQRILKDLDAGKIATPAAFEKLLALDPLDLAVLEEQAIEARDAGNSAETERLLRQIPLVAPECPGAATSPHRTRRVFPRHG